MGMTVMFSSVIYVISASQLGRPLPIRGQGMSQLDAFTRDSVQELFDRRAEQARAELLLSLVMLNLTVLIGGGFISYILARKTLRPIELAMEAQARFVSDASHELRTPLAALQVTNEVALRKRKLKISDAKNLIGHNLAETMKLRDLSESLLGLAKQDVADTAMTTMTVYQVVDDAVKTLRPLAESRNVVIKRDIPKLSITANRPAVAQLLRILIDNAIKYSNEGSDVTIIAEKHGDDTIIKVHDDGPGIASEYQQKVFDRFYRIDESRSSKHVQGSGLGLAIARSIADHQGYTISLNSEPGHGSTFEVRL